MGIGKLGLFTFSICSVKLPAVLANTLTVSLKLLSMDDAASMAKWTMDPRISPYVLWEPFTTQSEIREYIKQTVIPHPWYKGVVYQDELIGSITLDPIQNSCPKKAELGYVLAYDYWNKGIATLAVKQALDEGFKELDIDQIEALVDPDNIGSRRVCEKNGMRLMEYRKGCVLHHGVLRDRLVYMKARKDSECYMQ